MEKKLNFGIIGCGQIAARHAKEILKKGHLIAVADIINEKAICFASLHGGHGYASSEELIEKEKKNIDVMVVCSPNGLHCGHTIESLEAGFHVLCEKPMAISVADCKAMIDASTRCRRQLFIVKQNRFNPPVQALKKLVDENRLGKILSFQLNCFWNRPTAYYKDSWRGTKDLDGGVLYTQFSHFIDILCWLFGNVKKLQAQFANFIHSPLVTFEDTGMILMEFDSGILGGINYTINSYHQNMEGSLSVFGEKGTVKIGGQYLNELEYQQIEGYTIPALPSGNTANEYGVYNGSMSNHDKVYDNLLSVLQGNTQKTVLPEEGLKTVELIEKIYKLRTLQGINTIAQ
jgi:UDP-N-acetyl-2-amino-2-deoxyglucuronate dehydrogenase